LLRSQAGTASLIFVAVLIVAARTRATRKIFAAVMILIGLFSASMMIDNLFAKRDAYLASSGEKIEIVRTHPIWHSIYIGFSYLPNRYVPAYSDTVAHDRAIGIHPGIRDYSPEYEATLRDEVFGLTKHHPLFVILSILAKTLVAAGFALLACSFGIPSALRNPLPKPVLIAFASAVFYSSLPGILVIPIRQYLLGMVAFSVLFGCYSVAHDGLRGAPNGTTRSSSRSADAR
jgi:hypothetical protein